MSRLYDMRISKPNWVAKHMHAETIHMLFGCQFVCVFHYASLSPCNSPQHKTFIYHTEFLQYSLVVNFYVEIYDLVLQIRLCEYVRGMKS